MNMAYRKGKAERIPRLILPLRFYYVHSTCAVLDTTPRRQS